MGGGHNFQKMFHIIIFFFSNFIFNSIHIYPSSGTTPDEYAGRCQSLLSISILKHINILLFPFQNIYTSMKVFHNYNYTPNLPRTRKLMHLNVITE